MFQLTIKKLCSYPMVRGGGDWENWIYSSNWIEDNPGTNDETVKSPNLFS